MQPMRLKEIRGLPVVDPTAARKIGTVSDYLVDPATGRLAALEIQGREGNRDERIPAHRIRRIGQHAVVLTGRLASSQDPSSTDTQTERWLDSASLVNLEVLGDDGNRVGRLADATFDQDSLDIQAYLLSASLWERFFGRHRGRIQPGQVASCSRELMITTSGRPGEREQASQPSATEDTASLGVPLKLDDRVAPPSSRKKTATAPTDGQAVPTLPHPD
jgi:sporulation protein YlmC with PRC-barrel domain